MKRAIIMMGLPCSGKTTWIDENREKLKYYKIVSADNIKENHPEYNPNQAYLLQDYSVNEAEKEIIKLANSNFNLVMDAGGINNSYTKRIINKLKEKDYIIKLVHIKTPYNICIERSKNRERKVPVDDIIKKAIKENSQFNKLKDLCDDVEIISYYTNKYWFVDMDGIIAALSTLPRINGEIDFVNGEVHKYLKPVQPVIDKLINNIGIENIFIMSAIPTSISLDEKNEWLDKYFPIKKDKRFFVNRGIYKPEMLKDLCVKLKIDRKDVILLDDTHEILYKIKELGMNSMHLSEFLTI